jgi:hypothetical protein
MTGHTRDPRGVILVAAIAWETVALASSGRIPTITEVCRRWRHHPVGSAVIAVALAVLIHHLTLEEGDHRWAKQT